jgi:ribonuclease P protein component
LLDLPALAPGRAESRALVDRPPLRVRALAGAATEAVRDVSVDRRLTLRERLTRAARVRRAADFDQIKARGAVYRSPHCVLLALADPDAESRIGFIASRKGVGGAVERNRARRRLREIVRRRWSRVPSHGFALVLIGTRTTPTVPHQTLASEVERLLSAAGALAPVRVEP